MKELIKKVKQKGFWRINIKPTEFIEQRLSTIEDCVDTINTCKVVLRGWDYPHIDKTGVNVSGNDSIESSCDWEEGGHFEYWRLYQSGQFVHYFSMREDYVIDEEQLKKIQFNYHTSAKKFLSIISTLFSITEIFEFAQRLMEKGVMGDEVEIVIELGDIEGRQLFFWDSFSRHLSQNYICAFRDENIIVKRVVKKEELLSGGKEMALDACMEVFKKFGWLKVLKQAFVEDQKKFLERRL